MSQETAAPAGDVGSTTKPKIYPLESISVISPANIIDTKVQIPPEKPNDGPKGPSPFEVKKQLFWVSQTAAQTGTTWLQSFLGLGLLDLYRYQHELAEIGEALYDPQKYGADDIEDRLSDPWCQQLRTTLRDYYQAIQAFRSILETPELQINFWREASQDISARVGNPLGYSVGTWLDLRNPVPPVDEIRSILQKVLPVKSVLDDNDAMLGDYLAYAKASLSGRCRIPGDEGVYRLASKYGDGPLVSRGRAQGRYVSPTVDVLGRLIVALIGGIFFLAPLIIMTFVESHNHRLIVVCVAVFLFSMAIAFFSESSNQELIGATAAYAAVLVVYVGTRDCKLARILAFENENMSCQCKEKCFLKQPSNL